MKISAQMTVVIAAIFASVCFGVAFNGFGAIAEMTDPQQIEDSRGFALFWMFLGFVAAAFGAISVWMIRTHRDGDE